MLADRLAARRDARGQQFARADQDAGRAIAALQRVALLEGALKIGDRTGIRQALDGFHVRAVALHREGQAAADDLAIQQHRAGAAHAMLAADMTAGQRQILAKKIDQCLACLDAGRDGLAVHVKRDLEVARAHSCPERLSPRYG